MNRDSLLTSLYPYLTDGGAICIIDPDRSEQGNREWRDSLHYIVQKWYGEKRRAGEAYYEHPKEAYEDIIRRSPFHLEQVRIPSFEWKWSISSLIGYIYSTSFGAKRYVGEDAPYFEQEVRESLHPFEEAGALTESIDLVVNVAWKDKKRGG
ncbi:hypothetical protein ACFFGV_05315 [Pontibacillus salicampi]|uniref:SAM-dependent methyltransferase n=1 Tax=Pontibacillus salicampi TaxID=1449801 RepID=A0ABV6LL03_9BACI